VAVLILLSCCCWYLIGRQAWMAFSPSLPAIRTSAPGGVNFSLPATRTPGATQTPGITQTPASTAIAPSIVDDNFVVAIFGRQTQKDWRAEEYVRSVIVLKESFTSELGIQPDLTELFGVSADVTMAEKLGVKTSFEMPNDALQGWITPTGKVYFPDRTNYIYGQLSCVRWDGINLTAFTDDLGHTGSLLSAPTPAAEPRSK
jgi:hypothetical protein